MKDERKTKKQLIDELKELRLRCAEMEVSEAELKRVNELLGKNKTQHHMLVETMYDGLGVLDENGITTYVNDRLCKMTGYSRDEIIGHLVTDFLDKSSKDVWTDLMSQRIKRTLKPYELILVKKDGKKIYTLVSSTVIFDQKGNFEGSFAVITDISEIKQIEKVLQERGKKYHLIFENSPFGICHFDQKGVVTACNDKLAEILGASKENVIGVDMPNTFEDKRKIVALETALAGGIGHFEGDYVSITGGKASTIRTVYSPIISDDGSILGGIAITEDISQRERAEELLRKEHEQLLSRSGYNSLTPERREWECHTCDRDDAGYHRDKAG